MGLVKMGWVGLDGTKLRANASRHQAMSYDWLVEREPVLAAEVDRLRTLIAEMFADAEATDLAEDARFGADGRQGDLPGELARRETRLAKMRAAKHDLETEAADRARAAAQTRAQTRARDRHAGGGPHPDPTPGHGEHGEQDGGSGASGELAVRAAGDPAAAAARPTPRAQRNFTDPESRIMKNADGRSCQPTTPKPSSMTPTRSSSPLTWTTAPPTIPSSPQCSTWPRPTPGSRHVRPLPTPATAHTPTWPPQPNARPNTAPRR